MPRARRLARSSPGHVVRVRLAVVGVAPVVVVPCAEWTHLGLPSLGVYYEGLRNQNGDGGTIKPHDLDDHGMIIVCNHNEKPKGHPFGEIKELAKQRLQECHSATRRLHWIESCFSLASAQVRVQPSTAPASTRGTVPRGKSRSTASSSSKFHSLGAIQSDRIGCLP